MTRVESRGEQRFQLGFKATAPTAAANDGSVGDQVIADAAFRAIGLEGRQALDRQDANTVVIAVSGGGDSMALACLAASWARRSGSRLLAVTVDHGLRPDSADEARHVGRLLAPLNLDHRIVTWRHGPISSGIQAKAREARYRLLQSVCRDVGAGWLLTAHTAEDQAETIAMRVLRRSGPDGLAGMPGFRDLGGRGLGRVRHGRPLLGWSRSDLRRVCREAGLRWIEDPFNENTAFTRIALRRILGPAAVPSPDAGHRSGLARDLLRLGHAMGVARCHIEKAVRLAVGQVASITEDGGAEVSTRRLTALPPAVARRVLARVMTAIGGRSFPVDAADGARVLEAASAGRSGPLAAGRALSLAGCLCRSTIGGRDGPFADEPVLSLLREPGRVSARIAVEAGEVCRWDHRFSVGPAPYPGWIVARRTVGNSAADSDYSRIGDRFPPFGCGGLQAADARLATLPVLCDDAGRLIAAPDRPTQWMGDEQGRETFGFCWAPTIDPRRCDFGVVGTG